MTIADGMRHGSHRYRVPTTLAAIALVMTSFALFPGQAGASTLTSPDGNTTLTTIGTVTPGTPYSSDQGLDLVVQPNSVISEPTLAADGLGTTGHYFLAECTDAGGTAANLPTAPKNCEDATIVRTPWSTTGGFSLTAADPFIVFDLPDPTTLGPPTMTGVCDVAPNECVVGIFVVNPYNAAAFTDPHLFSAPFQVTASDGLDQGDNPGDGTPEAPYAVALPLLAVGLMGGTVLVRRRRSAKAS